jgi:hypothetical protein
VTCGLVLGCLDFYVRTCIFCGEAVNSKEHVFAEWLIERMGLEDYPVRIGHRVEDELSLRPNSHGLRALTVKAVCKRCNSGWMSELESWFQKAGGFLVESTWPKLAQTFIEFLQLEAEKMAAWSLKTAIMIDRAGMHPKIPSSVPSHLFTGAFPNCLRVDLGYIKSAAVGCHTIPGFVTQNGNQPLGFQSRADGMAFQTVFQLNHLGVHVFSAPDAASAYIRPDLMLIRVYPPLKFSNICEYQSLAQFQGNLVVAAGCPA